MAVSKEEFASLHREQLAAIGFPSHLLPRLFSKLSSKQREVLDLHFELCPDNNRTLSACGRVLKTRHALKAFSDVFILQHAWEGDGCLETRKTLLERPDLLAKVKDLLQCGKKRNGGEEEDDADKVKEDILTLVMQQSGRSKSIALRALESCSYDVIAAILSTTESQETSEEEEEEVKKKNTISKVKGRAGVDHAHLSYEEFQKGLSGMGGGGTSDLSPDSIRSLYEDYVRRTQSPQTLHGRSARRDEEGWVHCGQYKWRDGGEEEEEGVVTVCVPLPVGTDKKKIVSKVTAKRWDFSLVGDELRIGSKFTHRVIPDECFWILDDNGDVILSLQKGDEEEEWEGLLVGEGQMGVEEVKALARLRKSSLEYGVEVVMETMWYVSQTYQMVTPQGHQKPIWYLLESHGLSLTHSQKPNFACRPFANAITGQVLSLLWPLEDVEEGDMCSRNFLPPLYSGETEESIAAREEMIMGFKGQPQRLGLDSLPDNISTTETLSTNYTPLSISPSSLSNTSHPISLCVLTNTHHPTDWGDGLTGYSVSGNPSESDILFGYHELLPRDSATLRAPFARLYGDAVFVHKTKFCVVMRGRRGCVEAVDVRGEVCAVMEVVRGDGRMVRGEEGVVKGEGGMVKGWWVISPDGPWSAIPCHLTNSALEVMRWSEVGPGVASQFCLSTVVYNHHRCCLQFSVVVLSAAQGYRVHMHPVPRVRLTAQPLSDEGFQPWNTPTLITTPESTVQWDHILLTLQSTYTGQWKQLQPLVIEAVTGVFDAGLSHCSGAGRALYTVNILLQRKKQLAPLIIGVDPLPSFANSAVANECLDLLCGRGNSEKFIVLKN